MISLSLHQTSQLKLFSYVAHCTRMSSVKAVSHLPAWYPFLLVRGFENKAILGQAVRLQLENFVKLLKCFTGFSDDLSPQFWAFSLLKLLVSKSVSTNEELNAICHTALQRNIALLPFIFIFFYVVHKIQTIFTTNKIKRNNYNKTWDCKYSTHNH